MIFWEISEGRNQVRSLTSQWPIRREHEQIGDPTLADGILCRLVHNAHRVEMPATRCAKTAPGRTRDLKLSDRNTCHPGDGERVCLICRARL
jgi:hypothetical protein